MLVQQIYDQLGGAANVVRNLDSLGGLIWSVAVVGDDPPGQALEERLRVVRGCKDIRILREPGRKTTLKTRVVALQPGRAMVGAPCMVTSKCRASMRRPLLPSRLGRPPRCLTMQRAQFTRFRASLSRIMPKGLCPPLCFSI